MKNLSSNKKMPKVSQNVRAERKEDTEKDTFNKN